MTHQTDYERAKHAMSDLPKYHLGEEVETPIGRGILVHLTMPKNGLYLSPEGAKCLIWFGTEGSKEGWVTQEYSLTEISKIKKETNDA